MVRTTEVDRVRPVCKEEGRAFSGTKLSNVHITPTNTPMEKEGLGNTTSAGQTNSLGLKDDSCRVV